MSASHVETIHLQPTTLVPNNKNAVLIYRSAFPVSNSSVNPKLIKDHFKQNKWVPQWEYCMYQRAHFHSTTHEALGVFQGSARVRFGVADAEMDKDVDTLDTAGVEVVVKAGDSIVIPAGVAHGCIEDEGGFKMVGAYPAGAN